jgi:hypothetical protein
MDDRWDNGELNPIFYDFHVTDFVSHPAGLEAMAGTPGSGVFCRGAAAVRPNQPVE